MKEIKIQSTTRKIELYLKNNIFVRILKLTLNPKKLLKKILNINKSNKQKITINWRERSQNYGKYSVIDTQTPKEEFEYVTKQQKIILFDNLKKYLTGKEVKILDFGCGAGRFSAKLTKLSKKHKVIAVDTERRLIEMARPSKNVKYICIKNFKDIRGKFDLIFVANVLGGLDKKKNLQISKYLIKSLNKNGILLLNENTDNNEKKEKIFNYWESRNDNFYLGLFSKIGLKKIDAYKYNHMLTSVFLGKK